VPDPALRQVSKDVPRDVARELSRRARRLGPLPYSALVPATRPALPAPEELAAWAASTLDDFWYGEGRPDPLIYVEVGAGEGLRARELMKLGPACLDALRVVLVEDDRALRDRHSEQLSIESPPFVLGPVGPSDDPDEGNRPLAGIGPLVTSLAELPALSAASVGVVIAYGWLGAQASDRYLWQDGQWWEIRLGSDPAAADDLIEIALPVSAERADALDEATGGTHVEGAPYASPVGAIAWLQTALATAELGWLVALDRWTAKMEASEDEPPPVPLGQLGSIRQPEAGPVPVAGSLEAVRWRLG
jgi:hypothetical protein